MPMELHGYVGIQRVWAWAQVVPMDNLVDGQRVGRWVMGWIWTSSTRPKPDPLPSLPRTMVHKLSNRDIAKTDPTSSNKPTTLA